MRLPYFIAIALIAGTGLGSSVSAKSLSEGASPVNFPPADFAGGSFVDNDGCIYIRAGVAGNTTWVPRVSRTRQIICGRQPTFGTAPATRQATVTPEVTTRPAVPRAPETQTAAAPAAPAARVEPPEATTRVRTAAAQPAPAATPAAPAPQQVRRVAPAPVVVQSRDVVTVPSHSGQRTRVVTAESGCPDAPASSQRYINQTGVRCGPQVQSPSSGWTTRNAVTGSRVMAQALPDGYRPAWTDGRLNPLRGLPDARAVAAVPGVVSPVDGRRYDLAWTVGRPHLLFDRNTGMVVADLFPGLSYPSTDPSRVRMPAQAGTPSATSSATVSLKGRAPQAPGLGQQSARLAAVVTPQVQAHRHIQVATYADMAAARADAQRLANAGLPTRIGKYTRDGQARQVIVLGPFASGQAITGALAQTRSLGFGRAFSRK
ncbi:MAG: SPOR domain-containing protein [Pseudomonadota bacterium]